MFTFTKRGMADCIGERLLELEVEGELLFNLSEDELDLLFIFIKRRILTGTTFPEED